MGCHPRQFGEIFGIVDVDVTGNLVDVLSGVVHDLARQAKSEPIPQDLGFSRCATNAYGAPADLDSMWGQVFLQSLRKTGTRPFGMPGRPRKCGLMEEAPSCFKKPANTSATDFTA